MKIVGQFINNEVITKGKKLVAISNPATGDVTKEVAYAGVDMVEAAVAAAKTAFSAWSSTPVINRARILFKYKTLLEENSERIMRILTEEHGKTLEDARGEIIRGLEIIEFACGAPHLLKGIYSNCVGCEIDSFTMRQPLGVCVGITPFNFPAMVPLWMFPIALVAGNTFVLKPSEKDPSCPVLLAELLQQAGAPAGILNVVHGDKEVVNQLLTHKDVAAVSFVGSTPIAQYIYATATKHGKRCQALGGAKNHGIIMPDADMNVVCDAVIGGAFGSAGERCMALPIVVAVGEKTADELIKKLVEKVKAIKVGPGYQVGIEMGPLVTAEHLARVLQYVEVGVQEGAKLVVDGRNYKPKGYEKGHFMAPCIFDNVKPNMRIYKEEIFGPVLGVVRVPDFKTALQLVNSHEFANGVALFTRDGGTAREFANQAQVGMIGINLPIPVPVATHSFGGWRNSLFGDVHVYGPEGINFYTRLKNVMVRWPSLPAGPEFVFPTMK